MLHVFKSVNKLVWNGIVIEASCLIRIPEYIPDRIYKLNLKEQEYSKGCTIELMMLIDQKKDVSLYNLINAQAYWKNLFTLSSHNQLANLFCFEQLGDSTA